MTDEGRFYRQANVDLVVGGLDGADGQKLRFTLIPGRMKAYIFEPEEAQLSHEDVVGILDDVPDGSELVLAPRDHVVRVVVGLQDCNRHEEHLDANQEILDIEGGTSRQYMSFLG